MAEYRQQILIEAPAEAVWREVGDPSRYPNWAGDIVEVTGLNDVEVGATYNQVTKTPIRTMRTDFVVEQLDEMREIQVKCLLSGYYVHWLLTEAGDNTFTQVEIGMDPKSLGYRAIDKTIGKRWYRNVVEDMLTRLRAVLK